MTVRRRFRLGAWPLTHPAPAAAAPCPVLRIFAAGADAPVVQVAAAVLMHLSGLSLRPHVWCRRDGPLRTSEEAQGAEARLLSAFAPTWEGGTPLDAAQAAGADAGALLTVGDAGKAIEPDTTFLVSGPAVGAASLERLVKVQGLGSGDAFVSLGRPRLSVAGAGSRLAMLEVRLEPLATGMDWAGVPLLAFAAGPERHAFFAALDALGAQVVRRVSIDGDRALPRALLDQLGREARICGAQLVTTERDATRLPASLRGQILTLPLRAVFSDTEALEGVIACAGIIPG